MNASSSLAALAAFGAIALGSLAPNATDDRTARPIGPAESRVGTRIRLQSVKSLDGKTVQAPVAGATATVVALTSTTCPLCLRYGPTLAELERQYAERGVRFLFVSPAEGESEADLAAMAGRLGWAGPVVVGSDWARVLGARTTTETFVIDSDGVLVYRGAVDDQYGIGSALPQPRNQYLADALDAVLAGRAPKVAATTAPGCLLGDLGQPAEGVPTFHRTIEPIVQRHCLPCHRPGGVAPFALDSYRAVRARGPMVRYVVEDGLMPPWFAAKREGTGPWLNDRSLPEAEKRALLDWIEAGMPAGDLADAPTPPSFPTEWSIGEPDVILQIPRPISVKASGTMDYQNVDVPTDFDEDKWVSAVEVLPTDRRVVHHVLVWAIPREAARAGQGVDGASEVDGFFAAYVPGMGALAYTDGLAKRIPKGSVLRFQIHYTPNGTATRDQTRIGLKFARAPVKHEVFTAAVHTFLVLIPPGAKAHPVTARLPVPTDVRILGYLPHMHLRGAAARYELVTPEGERTLLLDVPRYDFNWQLNYVYRTPRDVPRGSELVFTAWYDNSVDNPHNPDPTRWVTWGLQTEDEMHLGYLEYIVPGAEPGSGRGDPLRARDRTPPLERLFRRFDRDGDGAVTQSEAGPLWDVVKGADADGDGRITLEEARVRLGGGRTP